mmetsp:Transcript_12775/g.18444  ORF Transcript_12775/g.18444 Transcript_12775/m.18444 type:complete len:100 (-) Transcript_12775:15-314(-)
MSSIKICPSGLGVDPELDNSWIGNVEFIDADSALRDRLLRKLRCIEGRHSVVRDDDFTEEIANASIAIGQVAKKAEATAKAILSHRNNLIFPLPLEQIS